MLKTIAGGTSAVALGALPVSSVMAQDPVTITYWHGWTGQWENYVQDIVDAFHAHQDVIRVEPLVVPYGDFLVRLTAAISSGNPPDIVTFFGSNEIPGLAALGGITPYCGPGTVRKTIAAFQEISSRQRPGRGAWSKARFTPRPAALASTTWLGTRSNLKKLAWTPR